MVCAFGLPRYTADRRAAVLAERRAPSRSATAAKASSQVASASSPSRRTSGRVSRSGSLSSSAKLAPFGQMKPLLNTSSRSPRAPVTRPSSMVSVRPQVASHSGQIRRAVRVIGPSARAARSRHYWARNYVLLVHLRVQRADVGQVAVALGVVEAVADDELVGDVEADVGDVDVGAHGVGFAQQRAHAQRPRPPRGQVAQQPGQRQPGVDDVLDDQHVAVVDVAVEVLEDAHHARRRRRRAVGADGHELQLGGQRDRPGEVGDEHDRALEHRDQQQVLPVAERVAVVLGDLCAEFGDRAPGSGPRPAAPT